MTTTVAPPAAALTLSGLAPSLLQSCILAPTPAVPPTIGDNDIYTPVAPGVTYAALPTVTIVDTSPTQVIGCANDVGTTPQQTLNALFPAAVTGDGVVDRATNDFWVYDGTTWNNVGPNPGPTIVDATIIPPWNEILSYDATVRTRLQIQSLDYALALLTEPDPIGVVLGLDARRVRIVAAPALTFTLAAQTPRVSVSARVDAPTGEISAQTHTPVVQRAFPGAQIEVNGLAPIVETNLTSVRVPSLALQLTSHTPALVALPAIGEPFEGGYFVGLISHTEDGVATHALVVAPEATGASGTGHTSTTIYQHKTANTETTGTDSTFDGTANTDAMVTADITAHPAAQFCVNLSINGYTDWYLPAPRELNIAYRNLKPTTQDNITSSGTPITGANPSAVPQTTNFTATDPTQTAVVLFQAGNAEAFMEGLYVTSRQVQSNKTQATYFRFTDGSLVSSNKTLATTTGTGSPRVRAFRQVPL
jgi:hypothetical protein